ncbi:hypothetical protein ABZY09_09855 [Streptomyces sp. NPDC002928]|uniref:hypothetical protein n=1 Tax=Streptomyces sp. NPDC002928 TaxID=3154440 RepID=UPI0033B5BB30
MRLRRLIATAAAALTAATGMWAAGTPATPATHASSTISVADESPGYAVEDFNYPGADAILADKGITLKRGDGHITLADCVTDTGQLEVWARSQDKICFNVTGDSGYLTLEIPSVYGIKGNDYTTEATMTVDDETTTYDITQNAWTAVGESADAEGREFMLVELRTSK